MKKETIAKDTEIMALLLEKIPKNWDARESILEMKNGGSKQWRQMEWIGFYFQYSCDEYFKGIMELQKPRYGKTSFDGLMSCAWDFKAHPINNERHEVIVNDREAIEKAIKEYGATGLILALGRITYNDEDRSFQKWHAKLKGKRSNYEKANIKRSAWSRLRKTNFKLEQIMFVKIDNTTLKNSGSFQKGFRNSDGKPRREKVLIKLNELSKTEIIKQINFTK